MNHFRWLARWCVCFVLSTGPLFGWWESGHMAVALIAKDHLSPQAAAQVYGLLAAPLHPEDGGDLLLLASVWPDLVKDKGLRVFDTWHYQSLPYVQGSRRSTKAPGVSARDQDGQIVSIVEQCLVTLNPSGVGAMGEGIHAALG